MKNTVNILILIIILFLSGQAFAQSSGPFHYLPVVYDENTIIHSNYEQGIINENIYVVDGNDSEGYAILYFENLINSIRQPVAAMLFINIADIEHSESSGGLSVYLNNTKIGSLSTLYRDSMAEIQLDLNSIRNKKFIKLEIRANNTDGFYIYSKQSGLGATIRFEY
jgi:hypothetical protein